MAKFAAEKWGLCKLAINLNGTTWLEILRFELEFSDYHASTKWDSDHLWTAFTTTTSLHHVNNV